MGGSPRELVLGVVVGRLARVEAEAGELAGTADGVGVAVGSDVGAGAADPVRVGARLVAVVPGVGAPDVRGGLAGDDGRGSAGDSAGAAALRISVGAACRTARCSAGGRAGRVMPGNDTPEIRLTATAARTPITTRVPPRSSSVMTRARCPSWSANTGARMRCLLTETFLRPGSPRDYPAELIGQLAPQICWIQLKHSVAERVTIFRRRFNLAGFFRQHALLSCAANALNRPVESCARVSRFRRV